MSNITINACNSSSITFTPQNCSGTGWAVNTTGEGAGCYRSCTSAVTPSIKFSFTGSAVYYISTYFANESIEFRLDNVYTDLSLSPPSNGSGNSNVSQVIWYQQGLQEVEHTLELFPASNRSTLEVDTIVYTTNQTTQSSLLSTATSDVLSATSNALSDASNVPVSATSTHALDDQTIGIIVGTVSGSISGLILLGLLVMMCWRRRRLSQIRRSHNSSFGGTFRSSSVQQQAQNGHDQGLSYGQDSFSKYPDPIKTFPIPQRADPLAARIGQSLQADSPYSHLELNPREENHWRAEAMDNWSWHNVNHQPSSLPNYPKLEPLRKSSFQP